MADISQLADLLADTLRDLPVNQFEIALDQPQYPGCAILEDENISSRGGTSIQKNIVLNYDFGQAQLRTMYQTDQPIVGNAMNVINVPWTFLGVNYSWDVNELLMNKDNRAGFVDLIMERRQVALAQLAGLLETLIWGAPQSASDTVTPYGLQYYFPFLANGVTTASATAQGFNGQTIRYTNGTTGTVCAGIDAAVFGKWNSYAGIYNRVDNALLRSIRSAIRQTHFNFPKFMDDPGDINDRIDNTHGIYVNNTIMGELEDLLQKIGDSGATTKGLLNGVGVVTDVEQKAFVSVDGIPIMYNPFLDTETVTGTGGTAKNPNSILCSRWDALRPTVLEDMWNHETLPMADRGQHTTLTVYWDSTWNIVVEDRRRSGFRLHNSL
jgi:hypothetical protein